MSKATDKSVRPDLGAIRRCVFDIESPIGEVELCHAALHKLHDYIEEEWLQTAMTAVLEDLGAAYVSANRIFKDLFDATRGITPTPATPDAALLAAERQFHEALAEAELVDDDDARSRIMEKCNQAHAVMAKTPATTLAGAAAKMRVALDPEIGLPTSHNPDYLPMLQEALAVVERLAGRATS